MRDKARLDELRRDHGVNVPMSETLCSTDALYTLHQRMRFPVVVKSPLYGATVCATVAEAVTAFHKQAAKWGLPIIVQSFVSGEELNVTAVGDGEGGLVGAVAMKKLLVTQLGKGWAGVTVHDPELMALCEQVMRLTKWRGPCEVEALRDLDGKTWLIEVNPRFPAWCDLSGGAGQNLPLAVCRLAMGEHVPPMRAFVAGVAFVRISSNHIMNISAMEQLAISGSSMAPSFRRTA